MFNHGDAMKVPGYVGVPAGDVKIDASVEINLDLSIYIEDGRIRWDNFNLSPAEVLSRVTARAERVQKYADSLFAIAKQIETSAEVSAEARPLPLLPTAKINLTCHKCRRQWPSNHTGPCLVCGSFEVYL